MPRQARIDIAGRHYVFNRSKNSLPIFKSENDRDAFLSIVCKSCTRYHAVILAYVVTEDAYHLIIETSRANLSLLMRQVSASYAIYYNKIRQSRGSIWHDRFASWVIHEKKEMLLIQKYFANILVEENLINNSNEYKFSSFFTKLHDIKKPECFAGSLKKKKIENILEGNFDENDKQALKAFKRQKRKAETEQVKLIKKEPLEAIVKKPKSIAKRNKKIMKAFEAGYSQNEIAQFFDLSQSSVSKIVNASGGA